MKRLFAAAFAVLALILAPMTPAFANPIAYVNSPMDTPQALVNTVVAAINAANPTFSYTVACTGTTTATCTGIRIVDSVTGLTTAAGVTSATITITDTSVTAVSQILCFAANYGGTGNPLPVDVVAAAGSFTFAIQNTHASAALNATVPVACYVYN